MIKGFMFELIHTVKIRSSFEYYFPLMENKSMLHVFPDGVKFEYR